MTHTKLKIIFLDIDGVLNSEDFAEYITERYEGGLKKWMNNGHDNLVDPRAVEKLLYIIKETNAKLVISSTWRYPNVAETQYEFHKFMDLLPLVEHIIGVTPYSESRMRGQEIKYFMNYIRKKDFNISNTCFDKNFWENSNYEIQYCIIDDDNDMLDEQLDNFVQTSWLHGLTDIECEKIIKILNK